MDSRIFSNSQATQQTKITVSLDCWIVKKINDERIATFNGTFFPCFTTEDFERTLELIKGRKEEIMQAGKKKNQTIIYNNPKYDPYSIEVAVQITLNGKLNGHDIDKGFSSIESYKLL